MERQVLTRMIREIEVSSDWVQRCLFVIAYDPDVSQVFAEAVA